jgi:two-component system phosphate regulon sensor histidine kinase PhoR
MIWPLTSCLLLLCLAGLYLWSRAKLIRERSTHKEEQKTAEAKHQKEVSQLLAQQHALFDSMAEGLLILDADGHIRLANHSFLRMFGATADIRSKSIMEAFRLHELAEVVQALRTQKQVLAKELRLSHPMQRWLEINAATIHEGNPSAQVTILVFHDLTRIKRLESTRKEFVANVSHELRTPLSLIQGCVETLLDGAKDNPEVASKFLNTIERSAKRLKLLMDDLLIISELESGNLTFSLQPVSLRQVTQKVMQDFQDRAAGRKMTITDEVPEVSVRAESRRLEQVFGNLVDNSIKYGKTGGHIQLGARDGDKGSIQVFVRDDGPGIPADSLPRVFERFYRVDKARSREQGGTGLGLSIVKHIVHAHGGKVWAESEPGRGATFYFSLAVCPEAAP